MKVWNNTSLRKIFIAYDYSSLDNYDKDNYDIDNI